jgi:hypothetical protein
VFLDEAFDQIGLAVVGCDAAGELGVERLPGWARLGPAVSAVIEGGT